MVNINTQNILFICGGAFEGLDKIISRRMQTQVIGFKASSKNENVDKANILQYVNPQDIKHFGLIPELIGRLPIVTYLDSLDRVSLKRILTEPKNALVKQFIRLFEMEGVELVFEDGAVEYIVDKAVEYKLGARGLRSICEAIMTDIMFDLPSEKGIQQFVVSRLLAEEKLSHSKFRHQLKVA